MAVDLKVHLLEEGENVDVLKQEFMDLVLELAVFLSVETKMQIEVVRRLKGRGGFCLTVFQGEADRWILWELPSLFTPVFHQCDIRWALPFNLIHSMIS